MKKVVSTISIVLLGCFFFLSSAHAQTWAFEQRQDKFTDKKHFIASATDLSIGSKEKVKIAFECRNESRFVFTVSTDRYLADKEELFEFRYRVDAEKSKKIKMRAFTNSSMGGMNRYEALEMANDILGGKKLLARVISSSHDEFDAEISLDGSSDVIFKTARACGLFVERR
jgi:hypothetical protein